MDARDRALNRNICLWMLGFVAVFLAVDAAMARWRPGGAAAVLILLLPLVPLGGALWAAVAHHRRRADELERQIELQAITISCGGLLLAATGWGLLVTYLEVPRFPLEFSLPLAVVVWALTRLVVSRRYR